MHTDDPPIEKALRDQSSFVHKCAGPRGEELSQPARVIRKTPRTTNASRTRRYPTGGAVYMWAPPDIICVRIGNDEFNRESRSVEEGKHGNEETKEHCGGAWHHILRSCRTATLVIQKLSFATQ